MATVLTPESTSNMTLVLIFDENLKLAMCELVNNGESVLDSSTMLDDENYRLVVVENTDADNAFVNACLNDPDHITLDENGIVRYGDDPSEDVHCRAISMADWKVRVRPALMRATTTKDAFNL